MHSASFTCLLNPNFKQKIIKKNKPTWYPLSPPGRWMGGSHFSGPVGGLLFHMAIGELLYMGGVTISNFPGELQY